MKISAHFRALSLCAFALCSTLSAATIDTPIVNYFTTGQTTVGGTFQQFDPSLGSLYQITFFAFNGTQSMTVEVSNQAPGSVSELAEFFLDSRINLPDGVLGIGLFYLDNVLSCSDTQHEFGICDVQQTFSKTGQTSQSFANPIPNMASYIGTGTIPFTVEVLADLNPDVDTPSGGQHFFVSDFSSGSMFLRYAYDPATAQTPEPGSMFLFASGLGFVALGAYRRTRRN